MNGQYGVISMTVIMNDVIWMLCFHIAFISTANDDYYYFIIIISSSIIISINII